MATRRFALHGLFALAALAGAAARSPAESLVLPIGRTPLALGAGYDSELGVARGEPGACVAGDDTQRHEASGARYSIATLTRAGGRLVVGVHVSMPLFVDVLEHAQIPDAARRLQRAEPDAFRDLCGDGFVAALTVGGHFLAEVEVDRKDVLRAQANLETGTWSDPEPFRSALEGLVKRHEVSARELPGGSRAAARPLSADELIARALAFPATVTAANAKPYLGSFESYTTDAFSGMLLPEAGELDGRDVAQQVFLGPRTRTQSAASRAADLRAAQAHHLTPEEMPPPPRDPVPTSRAIARQDADLADGPARAPVPPPAAPAPPAEVASPPAPTLHAQAALVFTVGELPVFATTHAPAGVYAERVRERDYWVPGAAAATPEVKRAIEKARSDAPARGTTMVVADVGATTVVMTDAAPAGKTYSEPAGERHAWIAGVVAPNAAQRAAIAAAIQAEAHTK